MGSSTWHRPSSPGRQTCTEQHVPRPRDCSTLTSRPRLSATTPTATANGPWRPPASGVQPGARAGRGRLVSVRSASSDRPRPPPAWPAPCVPGVGAPLGPVRRPPRPRDSRLRYWRTPPVLVRLGASDHDAAAARRSTEGGDDDESDMFRRGLWREGVRPRMVPAPLCAELAQRPSHGRPDPPRPGAPDGSDRLSVRGPPRSRVLGTGPPAMVL